METGHWAIILWGLGWAWHCAIDDGGSDGGNGGGFTGIGHRWPRCEHGHNFLIFSNFLSS